MPPGRKENTVFINIGKFKRALKETYKSVTGVGVERNEKDVIAISAGRLYIEAHLMDTTKEFRGALIEILGDIPEKGEAITYHEDGDQNALTGSYDQSLLTYEKPGGTEYAITKMIMDEEVLYQSDSGNVIMVKKALSDIFDLSKQESGEAAPCNWKEMDGHIFLTNGVVAMRILPTREKYRGEADIIDALKNVTLNYPRSNEELI